jgi:hypothetical protein
MSDILLGFINIFLLIFGFLLFLAGIFTIYFGAGKSRKLGAGILMGGIAIIGLTYWLFTAGYTSPAVSVSFLEYITEPIVYMLAALLGAGVALLVFIGVITKA